MFAAPQHSACCNRLAVQRAGPRCAVPHANWVQQDAGAACLSYIGMTLASCRLAI
jgi:hypothetical protein